MSLTIYPRRTFGESFQRVILNITRECFLIGVLESVRETILNVVDLLMQKCRFITVAEGH